MENELQQCKQVPTVNEAANFAEEHFALS